MDNMKNQDTHEGASTDEKGPEDRKKLLISENETYKARINKLLTEIDKAESSISSAKEYLTSCERKIKEYPVKIEKLTSRNESLLTELNTIKLKVKSSGEDEDNTLLLRKALMDEHENLKNEKDVLTNRINKLEKAIEETISERKRKLPKLKKYDEMLKEALNVFHETESRVEVSLKLHQGRIAHKSENL